MIKERTLFEAVCDRCGKDYRDPNGYVGSFYTRQDCEEVIGDFGWRLVLDSKLLHLLCEDCWEKKKEKQ